MFVNSLKKISWIPLYQLKTCQEQFNYFDETMPGLIIKQFAVKLVISSSKDKPWVNEQNYNFPETTSLAQYG